MKRQKEKYKIETKLKPKKIVKIGQLRKRHLRRRRGETRALAGIFRFNSSSF